MVILDSIRGRLSRISNCNVIIIYNSDLFSEKLWADYKIKLITILIFLILKMYGKGSQGWS